MKKLFLFLILGIFLISFTSASYNIDIKLPYIAPNISVSNVSGGGWAAGDYRIVAIVGDYYSGNTGFWYPDIRTSPRSNYADINLSDGDGLIINYTDNDGNASHIYFEILKINTGTNQYWNNIGTSWTIQAQGYLLSSYPTGVTIMDDNYMTANKNIIIDKWNGDTPYNLNLSKGVCWINITSIGQDINMYDIISSLNTNPSPLVVGDDILTYDGYQLITTCSLHLVPATGYRVEFWGGEQISSYGGIYITGSQEVYSVSVGTQYVNIQVLRRGGYGKSITIPKGDVSLFNIGMLYASYLKDGVYYGERSGAGIYIGADVTGSLVNVQSEWTNPAYGITDYILNTRLLGMNVRNAVLDGQKIYGYLQTYGYNTLTKNSNLYSSAGYQFRFINTNNNSDNALDNNFIDYSTGEVTKYPYVYVIQYSDATYGYTNLSLKIGSTFNLIVNDNASDINQTIEGANVSIYDKNGNLFYNGLTDENGSISTPMYWGAVVSIDDTPSGVRDDNQKHMDLNPFIITIKKDGYATYNGTFEIYNKKDWTIALSPPSGGVGTTIYPVGEKIISPKDYPYLNYEISKEVDTAKGIYLNPYIIETS